MQSPEARLAQLRIELPEPPRPLGSFPSARRVGDLLYTTGVLPMWNGELRYRGPLGSRQPLASGIDAARLCGLNLLAVMRAHAGSLDNVAQVVQIVGLVNSSAGFAQQSKVMNGLSELLFEVFGDAGRHNRTALASTDLPLDATVQASAVVRLRAVLVPGRVEVDTAEPAPDAATLAVTGAAVDRTTGAPSEATATGGTA